MASDTPSASDDPPSSTAKPHVANVESLPFPEIPNPRNWVPMIPCHRTPKHAFTYINGYKLSNVMDSARESRCEGERKSTSIIYFPGGGGGNVVR